MDPDETPGIRLRALLSKGELIIAPGIFDGLSAHLVRRMGFRAGYLTGAGVAASGFGLPDIGLVGLAEMAERATMVTTVLGTVPLIADGDTGYGPPMSVARTVRAYERAGVAAIQLEDQAFPKRCGHLPGKELVSTETYLATLGAALDTRTDALIIARTDARSVLGLSAAIDRGNAYAEAGADIIFVEAPRTADEIARIGREITAPKLINIVAGGLTPELDAGHAHQARLLHRDLPHDSPAGGRQRGHRSAPRPGERQRAAARKHGGLLPAGRAGRVVRDQREVAHRINTTQGGRTPWRPSLSWLA